MTNSRRDVPVTRQPAGVPVARGSTARQARRAELSAGLDDVRARISAACSAAGRSDDEVTLVAVTKTFPVSDIALLSELGAGTLSVTAAGGKTQDFQISGGYVEVRDNHVRVLADKAE